MKIIAGTEEPEGKIHDEVSREYQTWCAVRLRNLVVCGATYFCYSS